MTFPAYLFFTLILTTMIQHVSFWSMSVFPGESVRKEVSDSRSVQISLSERVFLEVPPFQINYLEMIGDAVLNTSLHDQPQPW